MPRPGLFITPPFNCKIIMTKDKDKTYTLKYATATKRE